MWYYREAQLHILGSGTKPASHGFGYNNLLYIIVPAEIITVYPSTRIQFSWDGLADDHCKYKNSKPNINLTSTFLPTQQKPSCEVQLLLILYKRMVLTGLCTHKNTTTGFLLCLCARESRRRITWRLACIYGSQQSKQTCKI